MPTSVRLDADTESLLNKTAIALNTTKTEVIKTSVRVFCQQALADKSRHPYMLMHDLIGTEFSGQGNLAIDGEKILRKAFGKKK